MYQCVIIVVLSLPAALRLFFFSLLCCFFSCSLLWRWRWEEGGLGLSGSTASKWLLIAAIGSNINWGCIMTEASLGASCLRTWCLAFWVTIEAPGCLVVLPRLASRSDKDKSPIVPNAIDVVSFFAFLFFWTPADLDKLRGDLELALTLARKAAFLAAALFCRACGTETPASIWEGEEGDIG